MRIVFSLVVAITLILSCKHDSGKPESKGEPVEQESIQITALGYEKTNDSIPPQFRKSVIRFLDGAKVADFDTQIKAALQETSVNGSITLGELIRLNQLGDTEALAKLDAKKEVRPQLAGAPTIKLVFYSGQEIVYGLRIGRYELTGEHVERLTEMARDKGVDMSVDLDDFDSLNQPEPTEEAPESPPEE